MEKETKDRQKRDYEEADEKQDEPQTKKLRKETVDNKTMSSEEKSIAEGEPRVKFTAKWKGKIDELKLNENTLKTAEKMAEAVWELEQAGVTPVLPDGKTGGNAAAVLTSTDNKSCLLVTKSGKLGGQKMDPEKDVCIVTKFDPESWETEYYAFSDEILPTSDTPLHYSSLILRKGFVWDELPKVALHGHALASSADAEKFGFPISEEETVCSTKEDTACFTSLLAKHKYPEKNVFIRKDHGFLLLGIDMKNAVQIFRDQIKPHL